MYFNCRLVNHKTSKKSLVHQHNLKFLTQAVTPRPRVIKFFHLHHILTTCWSETTLTKIRISPCDMRVGNQVKSLHYFHSYAVHDRIDVSDLSDDQPKNDIQSLPVTTFVPSADDCTTLRSNYIFLVARVIVDKLPYFSDLHKCVVQHIPHRHSKAMEQKSKIVSNLHFLLLDCIYIYVLSY